MTEEKSGEQWRLWRFLSDVSCHSRSCEVDVQCKEGCKCWVRVDCEDPPQTSTPGKLGEYSDYDSKEEEVEEESSNEKGYQNAVST